VGLECDYDADAAVAEAVKEFGQGPKRLIAVRRDLKDFESLRNYLRHPTMFIEGPRLFAQFGST